MNKDDRYARIKVLIETGHITQLYEVFDGLTMTQVAADVAIKYQRLLYLLKHLRSIKVDDIESIARLLKVDERKIYNLIANQRDSDRKAKKKK